ncbi:alpha/beta fold hydrolase [Sphingomonas changnyeongensis]|uniref:Alpha/beta fold hydrolase n=1 Tax=Sphingomonas changnyeongensis TaxID=2698679 RepID=A0A7Z2NVH9_9SPHN|nr:alpha/beta hydrolase [Sphingomonas changnyeongensis]QHL90317.1 alpha/beta fold hydrolase [Sphingomonas changnyeongensis]
MRHLFAALAPVAMMAGIAAPAAAADFASDRISVTVSGSGPDVILVPGLTSSPRIWADLTAALPGYRYHFVQVRGFAGTPAGGNQSGEVVARVADEVARYAAEQKLTAPALIGHSMGGTIGMMVASRHSGRIGRLMVVDMVPFMGTFIGGPTATVESIRPMAQQITAQMAKAPPEQRRQNAVMTLATMIKTEAARPGPIEDSEKSDPAVVASAYAELMLTDLRPELARIAVPTTVLYVKPPQLPITDAQMNAFYQTQFAGIAGVKLVQVPDSYHFIMLDQPQRFREDVKAFLAN